MFSPPILFLSTHYNNRDHRKIMVIDGRAAFTGGVNLCDEYINIDSPCGHWKDVGILLEGDAVYDFTLMFMQMWVAAGAKRTIDMKLPDMRKYLEKAKGHTENLEIEKTKDHTENLEIDKDKNYTEDLDIASGYVIPYADNPVDDENVGKNVYIDILNQDLYMQKYLLQMTKEQL